MPATEPARSRCSEGLRLLPAPQPHSLPLSAICSGKSLQVEYEIHGVESDPCMVMDNLLLQDSFPVEKDLSSSGQFVDVGIKFVCLFFLGRF